MIELAQLRLFVGVAEDLHFSRAASKLFITQPALSRRIRALEQTLGAELFRRDHRRVTLTSAGRELLARARAILADAVAAEAATRNASLTTFLPLSIAFTSSASHTALPQVVRSLRAHADDIPFSIRTDHSFAPLESLKRGALDVLVTDQMVHDTQWVCHVIAQSPLLVALPVGHWLARGVTAKGARRCIDLHSLASERFVSVARSTAPGVFDAVSESCRTAGFAPKVAHEVQSPHEALLMVALSLGVAIVPHVNDATISRAVVWASLGAASPVVDFAVMWRRSNAHPALPMVADALRAGAAPGAGINAQSALDAR